MIIQSIKIGDINTVTHSSEYYYCTYDNDNNILTNTLSKVEGVTGAISNIFAATTKTDLNSEINRLNLSK